MLYVCVGNVMDVMFSVCIINNNYYYYLKSNIQ